MKIINKLGLGKISLAILPCIFGVLGTFQHQAIAEDKVVNVYSMRQNFLVEPIFQQFTKETNIEVKHIFAKGGLIERLEREGDLTQADMLLTADSLTLLLGASKGLAAKIDDPELLALIPETYRAKDNSWFGLTGRARIAFVANDLPESDLPKTWNDLIDPKWKGGICTRAATHPYNIGLISAYLAHFGADKTKIWLAGLAENLATTPKGGDRDQLSELAAGKCKVAISNTYYYGLMATGDDQNKAVADKIRPVFLEFDGTAENPAQLQGVHVNLSGAFITKDAPNPENALALLKFMAGKEAQTIYASQNHEYPVNTESPASALVQSWGNLNPDKLSYDEIESRRAEALDLIYESKLNN